MSLPWEEVSSPSLGACKHKLTSPWSGVLYTMGKGGLGWRAHLRSLVLPLLSPQSLCEVPISFILWLVSDTFSSVSHLFFFKGAHTGSPHISGPPRGPPPWECPVPSLFHLTSRCWLAQGWPCPSREIHSNIRSSVFVPRGLLPSSSLLFIPAGTGLWVSWPQGRFVAGQKVMVARFSFLAFASKA